MAIIEQRGLRVLDTREMGLSITRKNETHQGFPAGTVTLYFDNLTVHLNPNEVSKIVNFVLTNPPLP